MPERAARRPKNTLSALKVKGALDPGKHFDGNGLYLRVEPNGARYWVQRITIRGKRREIGLGTPELVTLAEAREAARKNRALAYAGHDPIALRHEAKAVLTFEEAAREVPRLHLPTWRNEKHGAQFISTLETYAFPRMGKVRVSQVTTADVLAVLTPIWTTKQETARHVRQRIGTVLKWAAAKGWRQDNPADSIAQALPKAEAAKEHRKALPFAEIPAFLGQIRASKAGLSTLLALEFLILTAARSGEVRGATWEEIDLAAKVWTIPASRMKAKRPHRVPLSARALALLDQARGLGDGTGLVFPGAKAGKPLSDMTLSQLVKEQGFPVDVHGFRTSFRMWAQERTNFPREVAEAVLAHQTGDAVERAYARSDVFEKRRKMMEGWAGYLAAEAGNVVRVA